MQTAATDSLVGRKLEGRYRILERIARGGMSTVYAAVDERLDRLVAVKVMAPTLSADPAFSDRFAREARAAARLTHLNAVSVYDQGHDIAPDGHHVFLVMELVEGRTLRELLRERGRLTAAEAVSVMEPVLSALSAAHRAGLVHRDIKPENILLSDEGVVKVADFGLARAIETDPSATRTGLMMGTVAYCAPEQIADGNADPRSDVYSAGVVFFELLTGQPPYRGESAMNVAYQHVHSRVPAPSSRVKGIPTEIDEIVVATTDSDPAGRPSDAGAFLAEIADARAELALPVMPIPPRVRRKSPRPDARDTRHHTPDHATTDLLHGRPGPHDTTSLVPRRDDPINGRVPLRDDNGPPPPVVIPPPKQLSPARRRTRSRRRAIIVTLCVIALGLASFFGARALIEWRFAHVPNVDGTTEQSAVATLKSADYHPVVAPGRAYSNSVPAGRVISTTPSSGTRLATGKTVTIFLSRGTQLYTIPSLAGRSSAAAVAALQALGPLTVPAPKQENSDTVAAGSVTRTDPKAGARVKAGQTVTIYVSAGPPIVTVPTITAGTSESDAKQALHDAGFKTTTNEIYNNDIPAGDVISINPSDKATKGSKITITVSKGPQMVKVPDIKVGTGVDDAKAAIEAAGLVPNVVPLLGSNPVSVFQTRPKAGASVRVGSTVNLYAFGG